MPAILTACVLAGCGRFGFDPSVAGSGGDGGSAGTDGDLTGVRFSDPVEVMEIASSFRDTDPSATADLLELYFASERPGGRGGLDLWAVTRASTMEPWSSPRNVTELNAGSADTNPALSADGLTIYFASDRQGSIGGVDVWQATRASRAATWSTPVRVAELSSNAPDFVSETDATGLHMIFCSQRAGGDGDLFTSERASPGASWSSPVAIAELDSPGDDCVPSLSADRLRLHFSSDRAGSLGDRDIWLAVRPDPTAPFEPPVVVEELSSTVRDSDPWLAPDGRYILFTSTRLGAETIFEARR